MRKLTWHTCLLFGNAYLTNCFSLSLLFSLSYSLSRADVHVCVLHLRAAGLQSHEGGLCLSRSDCSWGNHHMLLEEGECSFHLPRNPETHLFFQTLAATGSCPTRDKHRVGGTKPMHVSAASCTTVSPVPPIIPFPRAMANYGCESDSLDLCGPTALPIPEMIYRMPVSTQWGIYQVFQEIQEVEGEADVYSQRCACLYNIIVPVKFIYKKQKHRMKVAVCPQLSQPQVMGTDWLGFWKLTTSYLRNPGRNCLNISNISFYNHNGFITSINIQGIYSTALGA